MTTDFNELRGNALVAAFNTLATALGKPNVNRFATREVGIRRCQELAKLVAANGPITAIVESESDTPDFAYLIGDALSFDTPHIGDDDAAEQREPAPAARPLTKAIPIIAHGRRGRANRCALDAVITVVSKTNPKRAGSKAAGYWKHYQTGLTVRQVLAAGVPSSDINWNADKGFIKVN